MKVAVKLWNQTKMLRELLRDRKKIWHGTARGSYWKKKCCFVFIPQRVQTPQ